MARQCGILGCLVLIHLVHGCRRASGEQAAVMCWQHPANNRHVHQPIQVGASDAVVWSQIGVGGECWLLLRGQRQ